MSFQTGVKAYLKGLFGVHEDSSNTVDADIDKMGQIHLAIPVAIGDGSNAAVQVSTQYIWDAPFDCRVLSASWTADVVAVSGNSNYATFLLLSGNGAAAATTQVGVINMTPDTVSNMAIGVPYDYTLTVAEQALSAGDTLAFNIGKTASGEVHGTGVLRVTLVAS